jgi:hypothetical protein
MERRCRRLINAGFCCELFGGQNPQKEEPYRISPFLTQGLRLRHGRYLMRVIFRPLFRRPSRFQTPQYQIEVAIVSTVSSSLSTDYF